jgi:7-carboxy-7-deazaguanine synthase
VAADGHIVEVFRSIQGEGPFVGVLQVFVRFAGCSLHCVYCDSAFAQERVPHCVFRVDSSARSVVANPLDSHELAVCVRGLVEASPGIHSVSATGGEPLEQGPFLVAFLREIREHHIPVYLETNGLFEEAAREAARLVDFVSMDVKLPSLCGGGDLFTVYRRVLPVFRGRKLFCKVVVAGGYDAGEFEEAARLVADFDARTPFIIQPATANAQCRGVPGEELLSCYFTAASYLDDVRVIPQCHRLLGLA